jgi:hypothetical protein
MISTTRSFSLEEAASVAADYTYRMLDLMKDSSDEARADQIIIGFEMRLKKPGNVDWKRFIDKMNEEKKKFLAGQIDYNQFTAKVTDIGQKATYESMGMTVDIYDLIKKQTEATLRSSSLKDFEDQVGALSITMTQMASYLSINYNKSPVYLDMLTKLSQPDQNITTEMLDEIDSLIRKSFFEVIEKAKATDRIAELLMEMAFLSIWIQGVQYLDPEGMKEYQRMWDAGEYPKRCSPKIIFEYLRQKSSLWLDEAMEILPSRFIQKLCGNLAIMGEMGDDLELCKKATLKSLELSEHLVTEATPENIPGNLAAFYERIGESDKALNYYKMSLDAIKLTYPPVWADAIVYRSALILRRKGNIQGALETIGRYHPTFRGNASTVVLPSRKMAESLAEELAKELGYSNAKIAIDLLLG